ncbi:MAG TPA: ABC transporter substrate-binding protein [Gaiellaceae bacterium]|nr:ABC transporter substrate-binding protein [Gaiellaceae bacterium]
MARLGLFFVLAAVVASVGATAASSSRSAKPPIKITIIGGFTSSTPAELSPETAAAARARVAAINAAGGIRGRKVQLTVCDDHVDVNAAGDCARQAVADGSLALVGTIGFENTQIYPTIEAAGMVSLGAFPIGPVAGNSPNAICLTGGGTAEMSALPVLLARHGVTKVSALVPGGLGPATTGLESTFQNGVKEAKIDIGAIAEFPLTAAQFDAPVAKALAGGVNGVVAFAPGAAQGPLALAVLNGNSSVKLGVPAAALSPSVISFLGSRGDGIYVAGAGAPATSKKPGIKLFNHDIDKYAKGTAKDDLSIDAWASVYLFEQLTKRVRVLSRASILRAAKSLTNYNLGGIYGPLTTTTPFDKFPGMKCLANNTVVTEQLKNGKFVALGRLPAFP